MDELDRLLDEVGDTARIAHEAYGVYKCMEDKHIKGTLTIEDLKLFNMVLGYNEPISTINMSSECDVYALAVEELEGERKSFLERFSKGTENLAKSIGRTADAVDSIGHLFAKTYKIDTIKELLAELENGTRTVTGEYSGDKNKLNQSLGVYYSMGNSALDVRNLETFLTIPYEVFVTSGFLNKYVKDMITNLAVSRGSEDTIPKDNISVNILDKITLPEVRQWLHKDTKAGVISEIIGHKFHITSIYQDAKGADARDDYVAVPVSIYANKPIPKFNKNELISLLKFGITLHDYGYKMSENNKAAAFSTLIHNTLHNIATKLLASVFSIFAIKRQIRQAFMANEFAAGVMSALLHNYKSYIKSGDMIIDIVKNSTTKA